MSESVTVGVRIRPLNTRELAQKDNHIAWTSTTNEITRIEEAVASTNATRQPCHTFRYDSVFEKHSSNDQVYTQLAAPVVESALGGFNATIFAYGQTSSGKTHSMLGDKADPGITPLAIRQVLDTAQQSRKRTYLIRAVYVEIYNDRIRDLLNPSAADLAVREDKAGRTFVDAHETPVESFEDAIRVLEQGQAARHVGETKMNARSSRSHTVFTLHIESKSVEGLDASFRASSLNLVDLAGSERLKSTGAAGTRQKEGAHINQSLLVLGTIINRLSAAGADASKIGHLPYRDSKLTRLLRPALGGNARTAVLCAITPAAAHVEETISTLKFAERAKKVSTNATRNEVVDYRAKYKEATTEVQVLRERFLVMEKELASLRGRGATVAVPAVPAPIPPPSVTPSTPVSASPTSAASATPTPTPAKMKVDGNGDVQASSSDTCEQDADGVSSVSASTCTSSTLSSTSQNNNNNNNGKGALAGATTQSDAREEMSTVNEETTRAIALRAARDELKYLKAHVDEVENENEHLRARLRVKAGEFSGLRKRTIELRSKARKAETAERSLRRSMKTGYAKLEDARQQLRTSRKKGAHVRAAEIVLQDLSEQMHRVVHARNGARIDDDEGEKKLVSIKRPSAVLANNGIGTASAAHLALRYGSSASQFAALYGIGGMLDASKAVGDGKEEEGTATKRRPRPLPEDMVADIDDSDEDSAATSAFEEDDEQWQGFDAMDVVSLGDGASSSADKEDDDGADKSSGDESSPADKKKKSKWRSLRSFYGYTDGVYDEMMMGHKLDKDSPRS